VPTTVAYQPTPQAAFTFQATLDGSPYNIVVPWNVAGARLYIQVFDANGNLLLTQPLVGSTASYGISLVAPLFASTLYFYDDTQTFVISP
jgi:hypothetical protein